MEKQLGESSESGTWLGKFNSSARWCIGLSAGKPTLKEWMDFFKNTALIGFIFYYIVYPAEKFPLRDWDVAFLWEYVAKIGVVIMAIALVMQFFSVWLLTLDGSKSIFWKVIVFLIMSIMLVGLFMGFPIYFDKFG